ncbi:MAG TPA: hypothetical protein DIC23_16610 [Planctomycetaceae bacterium]|nr:hypothetical protein [Planctomycetaceae bacterium]
MARTTFRPLFFAVILATGLSSTSLAAAPTRPVDFDQSVAALLATRCLDCHSGTSPKGGLDLTAHREATRGGETGPAFVPGRLEASLAWKRVVAGEMPPKKRLSKTEQALLKQWILEGARWGTDPIDRYRYTTSTRAGTDWWSLQPLAAPTPPTVADKKWPRGDIDRFVLARLSANRLSPTAPATPRQLVRRLHIDLTGLPPDPATVAEFVATPTDAAYSKLVDRLLASPEYGERWGRHWLDVVRFGESNGFERNAPRKNLWPYRDWVIEALNQDMPYDRFVRLQLIGDLLLPGRQGAASTGFLVAGVHNTVVGGSKRMKLLARQDELEDLAASVGQTFLGLTVNCARCHDHKFDPIPTTEYYRVVAALDGVNHGEREVADSSVAEEFAVVSKRVSALESQLRGIETTVRNKILKKREESPTKNDRSNRPRPFAEWHFDDNLRDAIGKLHGRAIGGARLENGALVLDGKTAYVQTSTLNTPLAEKTLEAWILLDNLTQRGGGAISIQTPGGQVFDSIVFGEREPGQWMAGSNGFVRTQSFSAPQESRATTTPVHFAITYQADGTITGYRDGFLYGKPYKTGFQRYAPGKSEIVFGLRHGPAGSNKMLSARILEARLYDRALSPAAVAASADKPSSFIPSRELLAAMNPAQRKKHAALKSQLAPLLAQQQSLNQKSRSKVYTVTPRQPSEMKVHIRGSVTNYGPVVKPGGIAAVPGLSAEFQLASNSGDAERRKRLANWITSPGNALFSRVIVNRVWHYHFGQGFVTTPSDFGFNGGKPSHPRLLEWLTSRFVRDKFKLKSLHRRILLSSTYRQGSKSNPDGLAIDSGNRLLWRVTPRRAEAEVVRDSILVVAGQLNPQRGGPGFEDVSIIPNNGTNYYQPIDRDDPALHRRTVYRFTPRGGRTAILDTFDCPDPSTAAPTRNVTTTPLQALSLLNNPFILRMATRMAQRITRETGNDVGQQVTRAWQLAIQRAPNNREHRLSAELVQKHGLAALCRGLFNVNDFVIIE